MNANVNTMTEADFNIYLTNQLHKKLNETRDLLKVSKLYEDDAAELGMKEYFFCACSTEQEFQDKLKEKDFCGKIIYHNEVNKIFPLKTTTWTNQNKLNNFLSLLDEMFMMNTKSPLNIQDCSTHCGIQFNLNINENKFSLKIILSQKIIAIDSSETYNDGVVIKGQMLQPNSYLFALQLMKNKRIFINVGPSRINFNQEKSNFNIVLPFKEIATTTNLGMRKVSFYSKNTNNYNDIPYLDANFSDNLVELNSLDLILVHTIVFTKLPTNKDISVKSFLLPFNNNNVNNEIPQNLNNFNKENLPPCVVNSNQKVHFNNNNLNNTAGKNPIFFNSNFLNNKKNLNIFMGNGPQMNAITEENSIILPGMNNSNINFDTVRKNGNLINSNSKPSAFNQNFVEAFGNTNRKSIGNNNNKGSLNTNAFSLNVNQNNGFDNNNNNLNNLQGNINNINMNSMIGNNNNANANNQIQGQGNVNNNNNSLSISGNVFANKNNFGIYNHNNLNNKTSNNFLSNNNNQSCINNLNTIRQSLNPNNNTNNNFSNNNNNNFNQIQQNPNNQNPQIISQNFMANNNNNMQNRNSNTNSNNNFSFNNNNNSNPHNNNNNSNPHNNNCSRSSNNNYPVNSNYSLLHDPINIYFNLDTHFNSLFNSSKNIIKASNIPFSRMKNKTDITEMFLLVPNSSEDCLKNNIKFILQACKHKSLVINLENKNNNENTISLTCKSRKELVDFIKHKILNKNKPKENNMLIPYLTNNNNIENKNKNKITSDFLFENISHKQEPEINTNDIFKKIYNNNNNNINNNNFNNLTHNPFSLKEKKPEITIFDNFEIKYLSDIKDNLTPNPIFISLSKEKKNYDLIIEINNQKFFTHKLVIFSQVPLLKSLSEQNEENKNFINYLYTLQLEEFCSKEIFFEILNWLYTREINKIYLQDLNSLWEIIYASHELGIFDLEKLLIIRYLIPKISKENCLKFLKEANGRECLDNSTKEIWKFLGDYCLDITAKNFNFLQKNFRNKILGMEEKLLFTTIEEAVHYITEPMELMNLIMVIIDADFAYDVYELLNALGKDIDKARNFNIQNFDCKEIIERIGYSNPFEMPLVNDFVVYREKICEFKGNYYPCGCDEEKFGKKKENFASDPKENKGFDLYIDFENINEDNYFNDYYDNDKENNFNLKKNLTNITEINENNYSIDNKDKEKKDFFERKNLQKNQEESKRQNIINNTNTNNLELNKHKCDQNFIKNFLKKDKDICPSVNSLDQNKFNLKKKSPNFTFNLSIENKLEKSYTIFTDAFCSRSNSFKLKIDLNHETEEVSIFLVENGPSKILVNNSLTVLKNNIINYNAILFEVEVSDGSNFEKNYFIFFAFLLNQNQIIGYENFFNLKQILKKENISIKIWIREFPLYSAILQYLANNFKILLQNSDLKKLDYEGDYNNNNLCFDSDMNSFKDFNRVNKEKNNLKDVKFYNNNINLSNVKHRPKRISTNSVDNSNNNYFDCNKYNKEDDMYDMNIADLTYIFYDDNLDIDSESILSTFVFKYCFKKDTKEIEMLINSLRFSYIDYRILCIIARDQNVINKTSNFKKNFDYEIKFRFAKEVHYNDPNKEIAKDNFNNNNNNRGLKEKKFPENSSDKNDFNRFLFTKNKQNSNKINLFSDNKSEIDLGFFKEKENSKNSKNLKNAKNSKNAKNENLLNRPLEINLRKINFIQNKKRKFYDKISNGNLMNSFCNDIIKFWLESSHHSKYQKEIDRLNKIINEDIKMKEKQMQILEIQKKELENEVKKLNEREMMRKRNEQMKGEQRLIDNNNRGINFNRVKENTDSGNKCAIF